MHAWNFTFPSLVRLVFKSITHQKEALKYDVDVSSKMDEVFLQFNDYPKWLIRQILNLDVAYYSDYDEEDKQQVDRYLRKAKKHFQNYKSKA